MGQWSIAALYVAGLIGAGFASGQELVVFFVKYGRSGLMGIAWATALLTLGTTLVLKLSTQRGTTSYRDLFNHLDQGFATFFDWLYTVFLLIGTSVMVAGMGALGDTLLLSLALRIGSTLLIFITIQRGAIGVGRASTYLAPLLVLLLCTIAIQHLFTVGIQLPVYRTWSALEGGTLYASYNLGFSMALLASVSGYLRTARDRWTVALVSNLILGVCMVLLFLALSTLPPEVLHSALPLENLARSKGSLALGIYQVMLCGAMYSTSLTNSLALVSRVSNLPNFTWKKANLISVSLALVLSSLGFGNLVRFAYPILGLAALWTLAGLLRTTVRS